MNTGREGPDTLYRNSSMKQRGRQTHAKHSECLISEKNEPTNKQVRVGEKKYTGARYEIINNYVHSTL